MEAQIDREGDRSPLVRPGRAPDSAHLDAVRNRLSSRARIQSTSGKEKESTSLWKSLLSRHHVHKRHTRSPTLLASGAVLSDAESDDSTDHDRTVHTSSGSPVPPPVQFPSPMHASPLASPRASPFASPRARPSSPPRPDDISDEDESEELPMGELIETTAPTVADHSNRKCGLCGCMTVLSAELGGLCYHCFVFAARRNGAGTMLMIGDAMGQRSVVSDDLRTRLALMGLPTCRTCSTVTLLGALHDGCCSWCSQVAPRWYLLPASATSGQPPPPTHTKAAMPVGLGAPDSTSNAAGRARSYSRRMLDVPPSAGGALYGHV